MGADSRTVNSAISKIAIGVGSAGKNSANNVAKLESASAVLAETMMKVIENKVNNKK